MAELRSGSQSAARALSVLEQLSAASEGLGVREIARRLKLSPSIVQRLIGTLLDFGFIERSPHGKTYRIGYRAFQVGRCYLAQNDLHTVSQPELRALAEQHHVNAYLGVLRDKRVVYLAAQQSRGPIAITSTPGTQGWLHSTAFGKALLAECDDTVVEELLGPEPYRLLTKQTKTRLKPILKELRDVRSTGYAISDEENLDNVYAVGAVIRDASGQAVAALSGARPRNDMRERDIAQLCELVLGAADRISRRLGALPRAALAASTRRNAAGKVNSAC